VRFQVHLNKIKKNQLNQSLTQENVSTPHYKEKSGNARKLLKADYLVIYIHKIQLVPRRKHVISLPKPVNAVYGSSTCLL
jgi:hypothetical protein